MKGSGVRLAKVSRHFPSQHMPESKCGVNIITCAVSPFKALLENNDERTVFMSSILEEFAYGNISPEVQFFKRNSQYGEAMRALSGNEEKLLARLNEDEKILFQKYLDAQGEVNQLTAVSNLIYGFKLGLTMTAEAFVTSKELIAGGEDCLT